METESKCKFRIEFTLSRKPIVTCDTCGRRDFSDAPDECRQRVEVATERARTEAAGIGGLIRG